MTSTLTDQTVCVLRLLFASYGLPLQLVSDNAYNFTSNEFQYFMKANGVKHIICSPYHPSSNGLAERFVRKFKQAMKAGEADGTTVNHRLSNFLLSYQTTTHTTTNRSPSSLFLQREIDTCLDLLQPTCTENVLQQQTIQKKHCDQHAKTRVLN